MISETHIDRIVTELESESIQGRFHEAYPELWHYLNSESFSGLSSAEHQLLYFMCAVIDLSMAADGQHALEDDVEAFQDAEDENWELHEQASSWAEAKDKFFENYGQEDLLAFVEDMLIEEEGSELSDLGREVLFITAKSLVDLITPT